MRYGVLRSEGYSERAIFILDKLGIIRYIDIHDIDHQPSNAVLVEELQKLQPGRAHGPFPLLPWEKVPESEFATLPHGGIVMYCTPWCPDCKKARLWLKACGLTYTEVDITRNPVAEARLRRWTGGDATTPTFDIDGTTFVGFDEARLSAFLKI